MQRLINTINANSTTVEYQYDNANRLTRITNRKSTGEIISEQAYTLDPNGNPIREFKIQPQAPQEIASELGYTYNEQRTRLESTQDTDDNDTINTFTYNNEGQQTQKDEDTRTFDTRNRLTQQSNRSYQYDGNDNRLVIQENGQTTFHIYDASNNLLAEANENKEITRYYIHTNGLNQMVQGNQSYTYHHSTIGHTLAMTDQNEEIINQYAYSPFGRILGQTEAEGLEQPFKYVGQFGVQHEQNEIYYMRARYYDAETGRFLKEDPIGFDGGLNVSLYVGGNPVVGIDPSGLRCSTDACQQVLINNARSQAEFIFNLAPQVDSQIERELINHFFFGNGQDFFLTQGQTNAILASPSTRRDPQFNFGIGRLNPEPTSGRLDRFDFDPQPVGQGNRFLIDEVATRMAGAIAGQPVIGVPFNILPANGQCTP